MNLTLFKADFKANWLLGLIMVLVIMMYTSIIISMYDPKSIAALEGMMEALPAPILKAMGFDKIGHELTKYLSDYLYGFIYVIFPMIYIVIAANNLMAKHIDNGSMAYLLTTPNTRITIASTQAAYLIISTGVVLFISVLSGIASSELMFPGKLVIGKYLALNMVTFFVTITVASISFFFSCIASETRQSLAFGTGIPMAFFLLKMLSGAHENLNFLKYFTLYAFLDPGKILTDSGNVLTVSILLPGISGVFYAAGIFYFNKRSLSI